MKPSNYFFLFLIASAIPGVVQAQSGARLNGRVKELPSGSSIPFATVALVQAADDALIKGAVTDTAGHFVLDNLKPGTYIVRISYLGYRKYASSPLTIAESQAESSLGEIALEAEVNQLKEVKVVGTRPFIERVNNKFIVNVEHSVVGSGASAIEVLERSPGVFVGSGGISVQGRPAIILVDGKQVQLSGESLADFLKGFQSDNIATLELITEPSAKYDASAGAVINIRTKKGRSDGLNGTVNASLARSLYAKYTAGGSFNYSRRGLNVFGNYNYSNGVSMRQRSESSFFAGEREQELNTVGHEKTNGQTHSGRLGVDYRFNKSHVIGLTADANLYARYTAGTINTRFVSTPPAVDSALQTGSRRHTDHQFLMFNLNYKGSFKSGRTLEINADYGRDDFNSNSDFTGYLAVPEQEQRFAEGLQNLPRYAIWFNTYKMDYVHPFANGITLEAGAKASFADTRNDLRINLQDGEGGAWVPNQLRSNEFHYNENINAGYADLKKTFGKWNVGMGLRGEHTRAGIHSVTSRERVLRNYFNLFPNLSVGAELTKKHRASFSFTGGLRRPSYNNLNPFIIYTNQYTYYQGNPYLSPEINYRFSASHTYDKKITTTFNYFISTDLFYETLEQLQDTRVTRHFYDNLARGHSYGVNVNFPVRFTEWWESSSNVYANYGRTRDDDFLGIDLDEVSYGLYFNSSHQVSLPRGFKLDVTATYLGAFRYATTLQLPNFYANVGLQKGFWDNAGTLRINFNDVFWSRLYRYRTQSAVQHQQGSNFTDSRLVRVAFTYKFGNKNVSSRKRSAASEDEKNRALND